MAMSVRYGIDTLPSMRRNVSTDEALRRDVRLQRLLLVATMFAWVIVGIFLEPPFVVPVMLASLIPYGALILRMIRATCPRCGEKFFDSKGLIENVVVRSIRCSSCGAPARVDAV